LTAWLCYDRLGSRQDRQRFFEDPAVQVMLKQGDFEDTNRVLEFGRGTGLLAERLLSYLLPTNSRYLGLDISHAMVGLARERLRSWAERGHCPTRRRLLRALEARCQLRPGRIKLCVRLVGQRPNCPLPKGVSEFFPNGLLCLISLSNGRDRLGRLISSLWKRVHTLSPWIVGGCGFGPKLPLPKTPEILGAPGDTN